MLQRSPTYIGALPDVDPFTVRTNKALPDKPAYVLNRWKSILFQSAQYNISRRFPKFMRKTLMTMAQRRLPEGYDVQKHFGPSYNPWDQRLCLAPNGDLFKTIRAGKADVVTDTIERFTKTGIKLASGEELQADIIVTATGLNLQLFGGAVIERNGVPIELTDTMAYKGMMLTHMPNMAFTIGYTNASWTLKADLVSEFVCRVLNYMDDKGFDTVEPQHPGNSVDEAPADGLHARLRAAGAGLPAQVGTRCAVAAQAELPAGPAPDPSRQGRRRGAGVLQTPCGRSCFSFLLALRGRPRQFRRRRCRRCGQGRTPLRRTRRPHRAHRRPSCRPCADWCPVP